MTKVKVIAEKGESLDEAEEKLYKALNAHRTGDLHTEDFSDPAMKDLVERMTLKHEIIYKEMMDEIFEVLDEEYNGNF